MPVDSLATNRVPQVLPVQVGAVTIVVPPGACAPHSTVHITILIIVLVLGAELHVVVPPDQRVSRRT